MKMTPVSLLTICTFVPLWLLIVAVIGDVFRRIFAGLRADLLTGNQLWEIFVIDLFLGVLYIPAIVALLTLAGVGISFTPLLAVALVSIAAFFIRSRDYYSTLISKIRLMLAEKSLVSKRLLSDLRNQNMFALIALLILSLAIRSFALIGLYAPTGGDARGWAAISQWIVDFGKAPLPRDTDWYYTTSNPHSLFIGLPSLVSFFAVLCGTSVASILLLTAIIMGSLASCSIYYLVKKITDDSFWAFGAGIVSGLLAQALFEYYTWGGNAEQVSYFLVPILAWLLVRPDGKTNPQYTLILLSLFGCSALVHPYAVIYSFCAAIPVLAWRIARRRRKQAWLPGVFVVVLIALAVYSLLAAGIILPAGHGAYDPLNWGWRTSFFTYDWNPLLPGFDWSLLIPQLLFTFGERFQSAGNTLFAVIGGISIAYYIMKRKRYSLRALLFPLSWFAMMFLLQENNPTGMFVISFPLWQYILPSRVQLAWILPLSFLGGAGIADLLRLARWGYANPNAAFAHGIHRIRYSALLKHGGVVLIALMILTTLAVSDFQNTTALMEKGAVFDSPVTDADAAAFDWIVRNTPNNAVFLTDAYDAGAYIPFFTGRKLPLPMNYFWERYSENLSLLQDEYISSPSSSTTLRLLKQFNISYIYIGAGRYYGWAPRFNARDFLISSFYDLVYMKDGVFIFEVNYG